MRPRNFFFLVGGLLFHDAIAPQAERWETHARGAALIMASDTLQQVLKDNTVVIFSRAKCAASKRVKGYFEDLGIPYYALELDQRVDGAALQLALKEHAGTKSTPAVYIHGSLVGGSYDIQQAFKSGELQHWTQATRDEVLDERKWPRGGSKPPS